MSERLNLFSRIWIRRVDESGSRGFDCRFGSAIKFNAEDQLELERRRMIKQDDRSRLDMRRTLRRVAEEYVLPQTQKSD